DIQMNFLHTNAYIKAVYNHNLNVFLTDQCAHEPVFTPSRLVVKHGDPTSASCSICQHGCRYGNPGLEKPIGTHTRNGTMFSWRVNSMTEWDMSIMCHYKDLETQKQCCGTLPITVYKPPDTVSISVNHTGPMVEGRQYTLQCTVQDVAPVGNLTVTFYRRQTSLVQTGSNKTTKAPVTETFTLKISPSKDDDGAQYWCEAKLQLGPEAPQDLPVTVSQNLTATVYYKPQLNHPSKRTITITHGSHLQLNCSAAGNPSPSYTWTLPGQLNSFNGSVFTVSAVTVEHEGKYTCIVSSDLGTATVLFEVKVQKPPDTVSISVNHNGLMVEGRQYTLQCTVQDVAPVGNLTVTFYRRQTSLVQIRSNKTTKAPVTETFTLKISPSKDDDGAQYWCEAKLQLGPEAPQDLPVMVSQNLTATVYYIPQAVNSLSHEINVTEGDTLHLNCSAVGNPSPSYNWSGPTHHISPFNNISVLTIKSVHADSAGQYNCTVENNMGKVNVLFTVHVKGGSCPVFTFEIAMVKNGVAEKQPRYLLSVLFSPSSCKLTLAHVKLRQTFIVTVLVFGIGVMNNSLFCFLYPIPLTQLSTANNISCILVTAILFCVVIGAILLGAYAAYYKHHRMGEYNLKKILRVRSKHIPMLPA
uniref:Ig-like domain-containing protein n=1 Tax=Mastacembelus armatus TaxID=205130 RepID=A0A3Q3LJ07_9TELE